MQLLSKRKIFSEQIWCIMINFQKYNISYTNINVSILFLERVTNFVRSVKNSILYIRNIRAGSTATAAQLLLQ